MTSSSHSNIATRFCYLCKDTIAFNEEQYDGIRKQYEGKWTIARDRTSSPYLKLDIGDRFAPEEATSIGGHTSLWTKVWPSRSWDDSYPELPELESCSRDCDFCGFLLAALKSDEFRLSVKDQSRILGLGNKSFPVKLKYCYSWMPERRNMRFASSSAGSDRDMVGLDAMYVYVKSTDKVICTLRFNIQACSKNRDTVPEWLRLREPRTVQWGWQLSDWARSQYNTCVIDHERCQKLWKRVDAKRPLCSDIGGPYLPLRLIRVDRPPRVVYATQDWENEWPDGDRERIPKYTALSYCWADQSASQLKLTSANSAQLFYKIPMDELSAAQRDAITVTKDMGFLYLWNDALCIQQDDPQDFKDEADQMGQTYQYAACTITSLRSNFQESFLISDALSIRLPYTSPIRPSVTGHYELVLDGVENTLGGATLMNKLEMTLPSTRWATRGWTFQEQNHSLRMLLFWPGGVRFICPFHSNLWNENKVLYAEDNIMRVDSSYWWSEEADWEEPLEDQFANLHATEEAFTRGHTVIRDTYGATRKNRKFLYYTWLQFATDYSRRVFGRESDVLPALWASAQQYELPLRDVYFMGIWKRDFWGFLWVHASFAPPHETMDDLMDSYLVPDESSIARVASWSWIGNAGIKFLNQTGDFCDDLSDFRLECEIDDSDLKTPANDASQGIEGCLVFSARVRLGVTARQVISHNPITSGLAFPGTARIEFLIGPNDNNWMMDNSRQNVVYCSMDWRNANDVNRYSSTKGHGTVIDLEHPISFMVLASARVNGRPSSGPRAALGLVLACDEEYGYYYRVGAFGCKGNSNFGGMEVFDQREFMAVR